MKYGEYLAIILKEKGISQTELSEKSGIRKQTIGEWLKGRTKGPTFVNAKKIAEALDVPLQQFADHVDED